MNYIKRYISALFIICFLFFIAPSVAFAQECEVEQRMFDRNLLSELIGIPLTTKDFLTSTATSMYSTVSGYGLTESVGCSEYASTQLNLTGSGQYQNCDGTPDATCEDMLNTTNGPSGMGSENWLARYSNSRSGGTLLGLAYVAEDFTLKEPLPANLAFYANDVISRVPVVNKAFAQAVDYRHPMLNSILGVWKVFRNIAYALMALILLYTGIVIILRRKINSQLVVSVQYALPRIIIAIVLITFSYPIGATLGSLGWTLFKSNWAIAGNLFAGNLQGVLTSGTDAGAIRYWYTLIPIITLLGASPILLILVVLFILIFLIAGLVFNIKAIFIYLKIIFSILTSPIEFAIAAIPGNDAKMKDWFLRMAKYVVTLFAMGLIVPLGAVIAAFIAVGWVTELQGGGAVLAVCMPLFVVLYCFGLGIGMESKVEEFMGIGQKKKR